MTLTIESESSQTWNVRNATKGPRAYKYPRLTKWDMGRWAEGGVREVLLG